MKINYSHTKHAHNPTSANAVLPFILDILKPKSVLDIGCGNGSWLKVVKDLGALEVLGVDGIEIPESDLFIAKDKIRIHDLSTHLDLKQKYDLVLSLEVGEHLDENVTDTFISNLTRHGNVILFSAAIPDQGGQYHINEQWPQYWNKKFREQGYEAFDILRLKFWNDKDVLWWYKQNMVFYVRKDEGSFKNFKASKVVLPLIHPDLYRKKEFKPKYMATKKDIINSLFNNLKCLFKK